MNAELQIHECPANIEMAFVDVLTDPNCPNDETFHGETDKYCYHSQCMIYISSTYVWIWTMIPMMMSGLSPKMPWWSCIYLTICVRNKHTYVTYCHRLQIDICFKWEKTHQSLLFIGGRNGGEVRWKNNHISHHHMHKTWILLTQSVIDGWVKERIGDISATNPASPTAHNAILSRIFHQIKYWQWCR